MSAGFFVGKGSLLCKQQVKGLFFHNLFQASE